MAEQQIRFNDGAAYERMMGVWSRSAGEVFLDWLAPSPGLKWIDIGCGNGAFTELIVDRCAPKEVQGVDPSPAQIAFARGRPAARLAEFREGDAMALPFDENRFDAAAMALVIFFVPDPAKGVAEMKRVVRPGGPIAAYAWDIMEGGFPLEPVLAEMRAIGLTPALPPSAAISRIDALGKLWRDSGLRDVETREITVERSFAGFDEFWEIGLLSASISHTVAGLPAAELERLRAGVRARLPAASGARLILSARANAVKGRVPG